MNIDHKRNNSLLYVILFQNGLVVMSNVSLLNDNCLLYLFNFYLINLYFIFLQKFFKLRESEKAQVTMLLLWILELMLSELALLRVHSKQNTNEYEKLQEELELFLSDPQVQVISLLTFFSFFLFFFILFNEYRYLEQILLVSSISNLET